MDVILCIRMWVDNKKTLLRQIGEGTFWYSISSILMKVVGVVTISLTLASLSVYEYGLVELVYSVVAICSIVLLPGYQDTVTADAGVSYGRGDFATVRHTIGQFSLIHTLAAFAGFFLIWIGSFYVSSNYNEHIADLLRIAALSYVLTPLRSLFSVMSATLMQFRLPSMVSFVEELVKCILIFFLVYKYKLGVVGFLWSRIVAQALVNVIIIPKIYAWFKILRSQTPAGALPLSTSHFSWRIVQSISISYLATFNQNIRLFFIKIFAGTEVVGFFSVAVGLFNHITALLPIHRVSATLLPRFLSNMPQFMKIVIKTIKYQTAGYVLLALVAIASAKPFLGTFFPSYLPAVPFLSVMLLGIPPAAFGIVTSVFYIHKLEKPLALFTLVRTACIVFFLPLFFVMFGTVGVVMEFVLTGWVFALLRNRFLRIYVKEFIIHSKDFFGFDQYDRVVLSKALSFIGIK